MKDLESIYEILMDEFYINRESFAPINICFQFGADLIFKN